MRHLSQWMRMAAGAGVLSAALLGACPALAQGRDAYAVRDSVRFTATQCDSFGERCAQVVCSEYGGACKPTGVKYYSPAYDGFYATRRVCDEQGGACHYLPAGDR